MTKDSNSEQKPENGTGFEKQGLQLLEALRKIMEIVDELIHRPAVVNHNTYNYNAPHLENHGPVTYNAPLYFSSPPKESRQKRIKCNDEEIAKALAAINGKDNVLNNYQLWLGACCLLMGKYGFPKNIESCCDRINNLPFKEKLMLECKYESIRKFAYLKFVKVDVDEWDGYIPKDDEKKLFNGCNEVVKVLDSLLQNNEKVLE